MIKSAIILAGGFGTRLRSVVSDLPKPMAPVNGRPFLEYLVLYLKDFGIEEIILSTGHLSEKINAHFGNEFSGMKIKYSHEEQALGTGGGIRLAMKKIDDAEVFVLNGDSFFEVDLFDFYSKHQKNGSQVSLALRQVENASRYGNIVLDSDNRILDFKEKNENAAPGFINGGSYILSKKIFFDHTPDEQNFSIEKDFFSKYCKTIVMKGFEFKAYFIDIGVPEDYERAQNEFKDFKYR